MRGNEVLQHVQAFTEVRRDRRLDDFAGRLGHQTAHTGQLPHLLLAATGTGVGHHQDRVERLALTLQPGHLAEHRLGDLLRSLGPDRDDLVVALAVGDQPLVELLLDLDLRLTCPLDYRGLLGGHDHVINADGDACPSGLQEADLFQLVHQFHGHIRTVPQVDEVHQRAQGALLHQAIEERETLGKRVVEQHATHGGFQSIVSLFTFRGPDHVGLVLRRQGRQVDQTPGVAENDRRQGLDLARLVGLDHFRRRGEDAALAARPALFLGHVITAEHDVLTGIHNRQTVRRTEDVVRRQHQHHRLDLRLGRQRNVHGHLIAVEVRVEGGADQRVDLDRFALDQHRLEGLDAQAMQGRRAIEHHRVLLDHLFEVIPDLGSLHLDQFLGHLDRGDQAFTLELVVDERLEQFEGHLLRQTALVQLQFGTDDDHRAAGVVHALAQQVLAETALLALDRIGERLQRPVIATAQNAPATTVVEQGVDGLLQHALLVAHDDVRRLQVEQLLQSVIAVDDPPIEIVEVRRGETPAVQRNERAQFRRNDRDDVQDHPLRPVARLAKRIDDLESLGILQPLLL